MNEKNERMKHESYGMLGFAKSQSTGKALYGSSIIHRNTITLTLRRSTCERRFNNNNYYADEKLFEVEMSLSQFGELISSLNYGDGIPVTIKEVNGKQMEDCPYVNYTKKHYDEFKKEYKELNADALKMLNDLTERFKSSKPMTKKEKEEVLSILKQFQYNLDENNSFRDEQFRKHIEKVTTDAKAEIESYFNNAVNSIGLKSIAKNVKMPVELISEKEEV